MKINKYAYKYLLGLTWKGFKVWIPTGAEAV